MDDMLSVLLDLGFDPDETATPAEDANTSWGMPLWFAAMCGRHEIAELLLACNANRTADEKLKALLRRRSSRDIDSPNHLICLFRAKRDYKLFV